MQLEPTDDDAPAAPIVAEFLRTLLAGRLEAAADYTTPDMVFLRRRGWRGENTPFRDDARFQEGSLRQLAPAEVAALPADKQRDAFEVVIVPGEFVFFAIIRTASTLATLGIIARETGAGFAIARLFDTKNIKALLLAAD